MTYTDAHIRQLERENALLKQDNEFLKSTGDVLQGRQMSYRFIRRHEQAHAVRRKCMLVRIYRGSYYPWKKRKPGQREEENEALIENIRRIPTPSRRTYSPHGCLPS